MWATAPWCPSRPFPTERRACNGTDLSENLAGKKKKEREKKKFEAAEVTQACEPAQQGDAGGSSSATRALGRAWARPVVTSTCHQTTAELTCKIYTAVTALHVGK